MWALWPVWESGRVIGKERVREIDEVWLGKEVLKTKSEGRGCWVQQLGPGLQMWTSDHR